MIKTIPHSISEEHTRKLNEEINDQLVEIQMGLKRLDQGSTRIELMQGIGLIEAACGRLTSLAKLIR